MSPKARLLAPFASVAALLVTFALAASLNWLLLAQRQLAGRTFVVWPSVAVMLLANVLLAACWLVLAWVVLFRRRGGRITALIYALAGLVLVALFPLEWSGLLARGLPNSWRAFFPTWPPAPNTYLGQSGAVAFVIGLAGLLRHESVQEHPGLDGRFMNASESGTDTRSTTAEG